MSMDPRFTAPPRPPACAAWLVRHLCVREHVEEVQGDLSELYARTAHANGLGQARLQYWREALGLCVRRSRFGARRHSLHVADFAPRAHLYWGRARITLGIIGVFAAAAAVVLSLGGSKYACWAAALLWLAPEPVYLLYVWMRSGGERGGSSRRRSRSA
jgi:hypothetical protein